MRILIAICVLCIEQVSRIYKESLQINVKMLKVNVDIIRARQIEAINYIFLSFIRITLQER
jgi:hypothetical protein